MKFLIHDSGNKKTAIDDAQSQKSKFLQVNVINTFFKKKIWLFKRTEISKFPSYQFPLPSYQWEWGKQNRGKKETKMVISEAEFLEMQDNELHLNSHLLKGNQKSAMWMEFRDSFPCRFWEYKRGNPTCPGFGTNNNATLLQTFNSSETRMTCPSITA